VLDAILLLGAAAQLLRQIAVAYGYRPGTLALRSLALAAGRDAGAVVLADALAQAVAQSAAHSVAQAGDVIVAMGGATATGIGALIGIPVPAWRWPDGRSVPLAVPSAGARPARGASIDLG
jgi:hypothetical protein